MYSIKDNIQYLLYGQMIPEHGFKEDLKSKKGSNVLKSLKTKNLRDYMDKTREIENLSIQVNKSKYEIDQFNQIKNCLNNFSFNHAGQKQISVDIIDNCMDELRRERKIEMVLSDDNIEGYIQFDQSNHNDPKEDGLTPFQKD